MNWFDGSTSDAVRCVREQCKKLLVFYKGNDDASERMDSNFDSDFAVTCNHFICLRLETPSEAASQFSAVYTVQTVPCVYLIAPTGEVLDVKLGETNKSDLREWLSKHIQEPGFSHQQLSAKLEVKPSTTPAPSLVTPTCSNPPEDCAQCASHVVEEQQRPSVPVEMAKIRDKDAKDRQRSREMDELMLERRKDEAEKRRLRECLRQQIEDDRRAKLERAGFSDLSSPSPPSVFESNALKSCTSFSTVCNDKVRLQLRFVDGGHIVGCFSNTATLAGEVRNWLQDLAQNSTSGNIEFPFLNDSLRKKLTTVVTQGYRFRRLHPARLFDPEDETRSVIELELSPSAVLVLVPSAPRYTSSVQQTTGGLVSRLYSLVSIGLYSVYSYSAWVLNGVWHLGSSLFVTAAPNSVSGSQRAPAQLPPGGSDTPAVSKSGLPLENRSIRRQGNMARLSHLPDDSDDEQARWNGNSTAQL